MNFETPLAPTFTKPVPQKKKEVLFAADEPRTKPWTDAEYMIVDGRKTIYSYDVGTSLLQVHLPGGGTASVKALQDRGVEVILPTSPRTWAEV